MPNPKANPAGPAKDIASTKTDAVYFWKPNETPYGVFCQWHSSPVLVSTISLRFLDTASTILANYGAEISFSSAEQAFMFCKGLYFSDASACARILAEDSPRKQKAIGRSLKGFNDCEWTKVKSRAARVVSWYKFIASEDRRGGKGEGLSKVLLGTSDKVLAEASPFDRVWGIGYKAEEADGMREEWGENRLGKALMEVRSRLRDALNREAGGEKVVWDWDGEVEDDVDAQMEGR